MSDMNVKIDKFTRRNNFGLWQIKMQSLLLQQGLWAPLNVKSKKAAVGLWAPLNVKSKKAAVDDIE